MVTEMEILDYIYESKIMKGKHFFNYIFGRYAQENYAHPFAYTVVKALIDIEKKIPGYYKKYIDNIASINGDEANIHDYDQLMQLISELYVLNRCADFFAEDEFTFYDEPTLWGSNKNPEFYIESEDFKLAVEVKAPSSVNMRPSLGGKTQILSRIGNVQKDQEKVLPFDNRVKDFLISAESKFKPIKETDPKVKTLLLINWDDFVHEVITFLVGDTGLLTNSSFYKDENGQVIKFDNIDYIVVDRQLAQFKKCAGDQTLLYDKDNMFDFGKNFEYPPKVVFNLCNEKNDVITNCFQIQDYNEVKKVDSDYNEHALIVWIKK